LPDIANEQTHEIVEAFDKSAATPLPLLIEPRSGLATKLERCEKIEGEISRVFWCRLFAREHASQPSLLSSLKEALLAA
jgi:hypothetical protein